MSTFARCDCDDLSKHASAYGRAGRHTAATSLTKQNIRGLGSYTVREIVGKEGVVIIGKKDPKRLRVRLDEVLPTGYMIWKVIND